MTTQQEVETPDKDPGYLRIATEEAFVPQELLDRWTELITAGNHPDHGFRSLWGHYGTSDSARATWVRDHLVDLQNERLQHMDRAGIAHQILAVTAPGTQNLESDEATYFARLTNDYAAEACRAHPDRFSALAAVNFLDAGAAVTELRRTVRERGFKGVILNSHIHGHYITEERFFPVLEAAQELDVPVYLHPTTPSNQMISPFHEAGLDGAIYGFGVETGYHLLRIITSGVLDRLPQLKVVVGHLGEALPFWLNRIDYFHATQVASKRYAAIQPLRQNPSDYFQTNIWVTTSGMPWQREIMFVREVIGADRVMYAMDYPYQYELSEVIAQDELPISSEEKKQFFEDTARNVFSLEI